MLYTARRLGLYKILFYFEAFVHTSMIFCANTSFVWAPHPPPLSPTRLLNILFLPNPLHLNIYNTIFVMAITCKGQPPPGARQRCAPAAAEIRLAESKLYSDFGLWVLAHNKSEYSFDSANRISASG